MYGFVHMCVVLIIMFNVLFVCSIVLFHVCVYLLVWVLIYFIVGCPLFTIVINIPL